MGMWLLCECMEEVLNCQIQIHVGVFIGPEISDLIVPALCGCICLCVLIALLYSQSHVSHICCCVMTALQFLHFPWCLGVCDQ